MQTCHRRASRNADARSPTRHFTVTRANRSLVLVSRIVADTIRLYAKMLELEEAAEAAEAQGRTDERRAAGREMLAVVKRLRACVEELGDLGIELRDWTSGTVEFPALLYGREVRLCWKPPETAVTRWREIGDNSCRDLKALAADPAFMHSN